MAMKFAVFSTILVISKAAFIPAAPAAVVANPVLGKLADDVFDPNPSYSFAYDVQDALTGDSKGQVETRANGIVQGQYNVAEPDGTRRIVDYTADPINGFNAIVRKAPLAVAAAPVQQFVASPPGVVAARAAFGVPPQYARVVAPQVGPLSYTVL